MEPVTFADLIARTEAMAAGQRRVLVAIVGPPGAGKSTFTERLAAALDARRAGGCAVLAMDGYHFDDRVLEARGERARKGAPHTFDVGGLAAMLDRLAADAEDEIAVPVFDRDIEIARAGAAIIPRAARIVLVEGNWLLLDRPHWRDLAGRFDATVMLSVPEPELARRLTARWQGYGLSPEAIAAKVDGNDLPNVRLVREASRPADFVVDTSGGGDDSRTDPAAPEGRGA